MNNNLNKAFISLGIDPASDEIETGVVPASINKSVIYDRFGRKREINVSDRLDKAAALSGIDASDIISDFFAEKTGAEISEKLKLAIAYNDMEAIMATATMNACKEAIGIEPDDKTYVSDYELRGVRLKFGVIPAGYSWRIIDSFDPSIKVAQYGYSPAPDIPKIDENQSKKMREYNQALRLYVECRVQSLTLSAVADNIDAKKKYKLSAKQVAALGF